MVLIHLVVILSSRRNAGPSSDDVVGVPDHVLPYPWVNMTFKADRARVAGVLRRVKLLELDTVVLTRASQEEGRLRGGAVTCFVRLNEARHPGQLISIRRRRADDLGGSRAHDCLLAWSG